MSKTVIIKTILACIGIIAYEAKNSYSATVEQTVYLNYGKSAVYNIWSPNFPLNYSTSTNLTWIVNSTKPFDVFVRVFYLEKSYDFLTIWTSRDRRLKPVLNVSSSVIFRASASYLYILFTSDVSNCGKGFSITIRPKSGAQILFPQLNTNKAPALHAPCGGNLSITGPRTIHSPNYPAPYPKGAKCTWFVSAPSGRSLIANFTDVNIEHSQRCQNDVLQVWTTKNVTDVAPIHRMCGNLTMTSSLRSQYLWINFQSDYFIEFRGFQITIAVDGMRNCEDSAEYFNAVARANILHVKRMLARGFDANCKDDTGNAGLHIAGRKGHQNVANVLLNKGANVDIENAYGRTPLFETIRLGSFSLASFLHQRGANINVRDKNSETCLHILSRSGYSSLLSFALANGIDVNVSNTTGYTASHVAAENGRTSMCDKLLSINTNVSDWTTNKGETPLLLAARNGHTSTVRLLITKGSPIDKADNHGQSPIHSALKAGKMTTAEYLLSNDADLDGTNDKGEMPLHVAARYGNGRIADLLIRKGASVAATTTAGNTPLHEAVAANKTDVMKVLINAGADTTTTNGEGESAFDLCDTNGLCQKIIVESLSLYGKRGNINSEKCLAKVKFYQKSKQTTYTEGTTTEAIQTV